MGAEAGAVDDDRCRFLVRLDGDPPAAVAAALAELAAADRLAGRVGPPTAALAALARKLPTALLEEGGTDGDGAVLDARGDATAVAALRDRRPDAIVVADVATSRHAAMEAGEAGADAVLFTGPDTTAVRDCVAWWSELFVLPAAAPMPAAGGAALVAAGADLLVVAAAQLVDPTVPLAARVEQIAAAEADRRAAPSKA